MAAAQIETPPTPAPPNPPASSRSSRPASSGSFATRKVAGLPVWGWSLIVVGIAGAVVYVYIRSRSSSSTATTTPLVTTPTSSTAGGYGVGGYGGAGGVTAPSSGSGGPPFTLQTSSGWPAGSSPATPAPPPPSSTPGINRRLIAINTGLGAYLVQPNGSYTPITSPPQGVPYLTMNPNDFNAFVRARQQSPVAA